MLDPTAEFLTLMEIDLDYLNTRSFKCLDFQAFYLELFASTCLKLSCPLPSQLEFFVLFQHHPTLGNSRGSTHSPSRLSYTPTV